MDKNSYPKTALTESIVSLARPGINRQGCVTGKPYKLGDGGGLFLLVYPNGRKLWRLKYRFAGKENQVSLGAFPEVTLEAARARRDQLRQLLANGNDPATHLRQERARKRAEEACVLRQARFMLDNSGALSFQFGQRRVSLTPAETTELRDFLDATRTVTPKESSCL